MKVAISSGHGLHVRGASGLIDEVDEARRVVPEVAQFLHALGVSAVTFNDDTSTTQNENLKTIVNWHNAQDRDLDISVHFNSYDGKAHGTECLYVTQEKLASDVAAAIAQAGEFTNRGAKKRTDLYFLNNTDKPAILIEVCFVDSQIDVANYEQFFSEICEAIADTVAGEQPAAVALETGTPVQFKGKCSWFGGPQDMGVSPSEGLAFLYQVSDAPYLFLPQQPPGTTGLARRLNPATHYVACRWDYNNLLTSKEALRTQLSALLYAPKTKKYLLAYPADWGPNEDTDRAADISDGAMRALGITTDDQLVVVYPAPTLPMPKAKRLATKPRKKQSATRRKK